MKKQAKIVSVYFENNIKISVYEYVSPSRAKNPLRVNHFIDEVFEKVSLGFLQEI